MKLTPEQRQMLDYMAKTKDPYVCANWIAECCGHFYENEWASSRLPGLVKRGFVEKGARGWYAITAAGREALTNANRAAALDELGHLDGEALP